MWILTSHVVQWVSIIAFVLLGIAWKRNGWSKFSPITSRKQGLMLVAGLASLAIWMASMIVLQNDACSSGRIACR